MPTETPGECRIWGEVAQVFKSMGRSFKEGEKIDFDVSCMSRNDLIPTDDTQWLEISQLQNARYIEVYLNRYFSGDGDVYQIPVWQYRVIEKPTAAPQCPDTTKGARCDVFDILRIEVPGIKRDSESSGISVTIDLPIQTVRRLRVVAAQRTRRSETQKTTVADIITELIAQEIDALKAGER